MEDDHLRRIADLRTSISEAAQRHSVDAPLVGAILYDELERYDLSDRFQDWVAALLIRVGGWPARLLAIVYSVLTLQSISDQSFGMAQMKLATVEELIGAGYLECPPQWQKSKVVASLRSLEDPSSAPLLVAARLRQTIDHWQAGGVDISGRPEILATLYSIGLHGRWGVHADPQPSQRGLQIIEHRQILAEILGE